MLLQPGMSHDGSGSEDDIELSFTKEYTDKEHKAGGLEEEQTLIPKEIRPRKRTWCKCALLTFALTLTAVALIQLADSYGQWLEVRVFPPRVVAAAIACENDYTGYQVKHSYANETHFFEVERPEEPFVFSNTTWSWEGNTLDVYGKCVQIIIYSI